MRMRKEELAGKRPKVREVWCHQDVPASQDRASRGSESKAAGPLILHSHFLLIGKRMQGIQENGGQFPEVYEP